MGKDDQEVYSNALSLAKLIFYRVVYALMALLCVGMMLWYRNSEHYWGGQYLNIVQSKHTTDEEKKALWEDAYVVDALPKEYDLHPLSVKANVKQNKKVLREREKEAKSNNCKWSAKVPIER